MTTHPAALTVWRELGCASAPGVASHSFAGSWHEQKGKTVDIIATGRSLLVERVMGHGTSHGACSVKLLDSADFCERRTVRIMHD